MSLTDSDLMVLPDDPSDVHEEGKEKADTDMEPSTDTDVQAMDDSTRISTERYLPLPRIML